MNLSPPFSQSGDMPVLRQGMRRIHRIHLVGIGGSGMSGIAEVLHTLGYQVTGSDLHPNAMTDRLQAMGVKFYNQHEASQVEGADVLVTSTVIQADNPEIQAARQQRIPIVPRAMMLAELMRFKYGIAIAGAHGKTTTTSLVASVLAEGGYDPTFVIGGKLNAVGCHAKLGAGQYFVAEADESDASFLYLSPMMLVLTNIDADHLEAYNQDYNKLKATYLEFVHRLPFYGLAVICTDSLDVCELLPKIQRAHLTYGFNTEADFQIRDYQQIGMQSHFVVYHRQQNQTVKLTVNLPGKHNALNATAALIVGLEQGLKLPAIQKALAQFEGVARRFQVLGQLSLPSEGSALLIDDYGHHPKEIETVIQSAKAGFTGSRLIMVYQPHRYSRLENLFEAFVEVLSQVDVLVILPVYAAGEDLIPGATSVDLLTAVKKKKPELDAWILDKQALPGHLSNTLQDGDVLLMQGAGDIYRLSQTLLQTGLV